MAAAELRMPADIFDEMAGVREIVPVQSGTAEANVNTETKTTSPNEGRLFEVGNIFVKTIPEFGKYLQKIAKKLLSLQKKEVPAPVTPKRRTITVLIHLFESKAEAAARWLTKIWDFLKDGVWNVFKLALKAVWWTLKTLVKWAFELLWALGKMLIKLFWKLLKIGFKIMWKVMKAVSKMLWKAMKWIWKMIKKLAKAFWDLMVKLFTKLRKKEKVDIKNPDYFRNIGPKNLEPSVPAMKAPATPMQIAEPTVKLSGVEVNISTKKALPFNTKILNTKKTFKIKTRGKRESIIWRLVKKVFNWFLQLLSKLVGKLFGKIIDKLIDTVVRIIVRFVMMQIIGSMIPGLGNAFALAMTAITAIIMIADAVAFIKDLQKMANANGIGDDAGEGDDGEEDEDDDDEKKVVKPLTTAEINQKMKKMEAEGKENTFRYNQLKKEYLLNLLKQAEASGNIAEARALREALGIPADATSTGATVNLKKIRNLDINELKRKLQKQQEETFKQRMAYNKNNIVGNDEIEEILIGAEGEPDYIIFWKRVMTYIMDQLHRRYAKDTFIQAYKEAKQNLSGFSLDIEPYINHDEYKGIYQDRKKTNHLNRSKQYLNIVKAIYRRVTEPYMRAQLRVAEELKNDGSVINWFMLFLDDETDNIEKTKKLIKDNKVNLQEETRVLRKVIPDSNHQQKVKYNRFADILIELIKDANNIPKTK